MADKLTQAQKDERAGWRYRAVDACRGNTTRIGCVLLSVISAPAKRPPWFGPSAIITREGDILSNFVNRDGQMTVGAFVGSVGAVVTSFRKLADAIKATDAERTEMFDLLRRWTSHDYRILTRPTEQEHEEQGTGGLQGV